MANFEDKMCRAAAKELVISLESLQSSHFKNNAIPDRIIATIYSLNLTDQQSLIGRAPRYLQIILDIPSLNQQITELENCKEEKELENIYLLQGAPLVLMRRLFGLHASEFSRRRDSLNIRGAGNGRPPLCDEQTEHEVWSLWNKYAALSERDRFLRIAEKTHLDLHLIWSALRDYIDN